MCCLYKITNGYSKGQIQYIRHYLKNKILSYFYDRSYSYSPLIEYLNNNRIIIIHLIAILYIFIGYYAIYLNNKCV